MADENPERLRTFGERTVYDGPELRLGQVDVELPGGERIWCDVVHLYRSASVVLTDADDRVLLLWRHRLAQDRWGWELPGGLVDLDEEPREAVIRELEEQVGCRAAELKELLTFEPEPHSVEGEHIIFAGQHAECTEEGAIAGAAVGRPEWIPLASVPALIASGQIWASATLIGLLQVLAQD